MKLARAKGLSRPGGKGKAARNDNTAVSQQRRSKVKVLSSEAANAVGRPGFGGTIPGPVDGKSSVKRLISSPDPARGTSQPVADKITTSNVDLVGPVSPKILTTTNFSKPNTSQKVIRPPRSSAPVRSNSPGKVTRPGR